jgi:hypothetical protein
MQLACLGPLVLALLASPGIATARVRSGTGKSPWRMQPNACLGGEVSGEVQLQAFRWVDSSQGL